MMGDIKLKIRHAKRGNEKTLDLSGFGMSELPPDLLQLTMLEVLLVSNNKLTNLKKIEALPNLRVVDASNNNITGLHQEMVDMYSLDTVYLFGNPIVNQNPQLAKVEGNQMQLRKALEQYFGISSSSSGLAIGSIGGSPATVIGGSGAVGGLTSGFHGMSLGAGSGGLINN
jgi:Leucine-rich repeat (LRR) protein